MKSCLFICEILPKQDFYLFQFKIAELVSQLPSELISIKYCGISLTPNNHLKSYDSFVSYINHFDLIPQCMILKYDIDIIGTINIPVNIL